MYKNNRGFSFVELIVATVILVIVVAGVYAAFLSAAKYIGTFRHEIMAVIGAQGWLEKKLADNKFGDLNNTVNPTKIDPADLYLWGGKFTGLRSEVDNLDDSHLPQYEISTENLSADGTSNPDYSFKKITITVTWVEREI
ncbi:MAG: prepilin-type N-terminal cleavage/methylation domain-containing protein [Candidatus Omnitrophota bacterium]|nr:MAG: prepilin-type N-terminal cleavage/methylation domain-containing protein [Candidatus Omnitrophota bacterium]